MEQLLVTKNPFSDSYDSEKDTELVRRSVNGDREALNEPLERHNPVIFNIAIRMVITPEDAQDITQDVLIKVLTNLAKYDPDKAQFRTWLYRIAINHILTVKKSFYEQRSKTFEGFYEGVANVPDESIPAGLEDKTELLSEETKMQCMSGLLMCLTREQRLIYIVGELFKLDHNLGAEIFNLSQENFRKQLSRIRHELSQWMHNRCGLVNRSNPCRCSKKTKGFIERGFVNPDKLLWDKNHENRIQQYTKDNMQQTLRSVDEIYGKLYREQPMRESRSVKEIMEDIIGDKNIRKIIEM